MDRQKLEAQLVIDEGRRAIAYVDTVGKMTAGVGRNITDRPFFDDEIALMLKNDIKEVEKDLDRRLSWWRQMSPARQNVLANMCFNLGINRLLGFEKALTHMRAGQYDASAREMLDSRWAKQVGARAVRLATLMRKGEF
ncbi:glycoside hydrolase family protein [Massilia sp. CFBP9012]|uniref:glycoside hydrolase family protein n=1 Tax=Massilia sp. CFBP9012 TaxID=3096531 RepID=UPI002A6B323A|nr:glycoside hydrolase family protein [Massilia sp. CFBP9012]MDY0974985.1 glycoside hydrolase family protein [Massilia sp. CFBP9012]